jgi:hypothetical protein
MFFDGSLMKTGAGAGLLFISPLGKHLRYVLCLHFPASNNMAEYEALVNGLRIAIELGARRLDTRGDSQLVIDQVMKNSSVKTDDTPEPEKVSALPKTPSAQPEGEALRVEEERNGVPPNRDWQTPYLQYLHEGELPLDRAEACRLARRAKSFVLLGDGKELYHRSLSGILQ